MKPYDYKELSPLDDGDVRLLRLHNAPWDAELEGNLVQRSLIRRKQPKIKRWGGQTAEVPFPEPYDALSYTWGPEGEDRYIKILVQSEVYTIHIRPNLYYALRQLRSLSDQPLYIWVDALSINQEDEDEKSSQIQRMYLIYNKAEQVRIWLGLESADSGEAIRFVQRCLLNLEDFDRLVQDTPTSDHWAALSTLMRRPWFNRRWIIQEISLARNATIHCGKDTIAWRDFADCVSLFYHKRQELKRLFRESSRFHNHPDYLGDLTELGAIRLVYASDNLFRKSEDGHITEHLLSLEALMSSLTAFDASDPHDIVYAILWLAKDARPYASPEKKSAVSFLPRPSYDSPTEDLKTPVATSPKPMSPEGGQSPSTVSNPPSLENSFFRLPPMRKTKSSPGSPESPEAMQSAVKDTEDVVSKPRNMKKLLLEAASRQAAEERRRRALSQGNKQKLPASRGPDDRVLGSKDRELLRKTQVVSRLLHLSSHNHIIVNYKRPIFEVCKEFLKFVIDRSRSLDILCRPWAPNKVDIPLPTWIPQLDNNAFGIQHGVYRRVNADPLVGKPGYEASTYRASYTSTAQIRDLHLTGRSLFVKGFVFDRIKEKKATATAGIIPYEWVQVGGWNDLSDYPPDRFWRTLVGNRDLYNQRPPSHWKRVCREAFQRRPERGDLNTGEAIMYDCPSAVREYLERVQCIVWSRKLILLEQLEDSLGLAPRTARKGDEICILYGCSVPVVLRKYINGVPARKYARCDCWQNGCRCAACSTRTAASTTQIDSNGMKVKTNDDKALDVYYEFIGECYVHGMMDGEAFRIKKGDKSPRQEFELR